MAIPCGQKWSASFAGIATSPRARGNLGSSAMDSIYSARVWRLYRFLIELAGALCSQRGVERMSRQGVKSVGIPRESGFDIDLRGDSGQD